jgi:hypothetical protein
MLPLLLPAHNIIFQTNTAHFHVPGELHVLYKVHTTFYMCTLYYFNMPVWRMCTDAGMRARAHTHTHTHKHHCRCPECL